MHGRKHAGWTYRAGGPAFSLTAELAAVPPHVPAVRFMNFEGQPEAADLTNRIEQASRRGWGLQQTVGLAGSLWCRDNPGFPALALLGEAPLQPPALRFSPLPFSLQVTLFRVHKHFISPEAHWYRQKYKLGDSAGGRRRRPCVPAGQSLPAASTSSNA